MREKMKMSRCSPPRPFVTFKSWAVLVRFLGSEILLLAKGRGFCRFGSCCWSRIESVTTDKGGMNP